MKYIKKYFYFLGLFFFMFPPQLLIYGFTVKTVYFSIVLPGLIGMYYYFTEKDRKIVEKGTLTIMFLSLIYFILLSSIILFKDLSVVKDLFMGFIILFSCFFYVRVYSKMYEDNFVSKLFIHLNKAGIIQAIFVIATFISSDFKFFLYRFIAITPLSQRYLFEPVMNERFQGIVVGGFSFLSTTHALLLVIGIWGFFMSNVKYRFVEIILFVLGQIVLFLSILLIGRTGLIVLLIFLIPLFAYRLNGVLLKHKITRKSINSIIVFIFIVIAVFLTVDISRYQKNIDYAFELVIELTENGQLDRSSTSVLEAGLVFPPGPFGLLFGTGNFSRVEGLPNINNDMGYSMFFNGAGILGWLIGFSFYFIGLYYSYKYRQLNPYLSSFIGVFFIMLMIVSIKDFYYISHAGYSQVYFIMVCILGKLVTNKNSEMCIVH